MFSSTSLSSSSWNSNPLGTVSSTSKLVCSNSFIGQYFGCDIAWNGTVGVVLVQETSNNQMLAVRTYGSGAWTAYDVTSSFGINYLTSSTLTTDGQYFYTILNNVSQSGFVANSIMTGASDLSSWTRANNNSLNGIALGQIQYCPYTETYIYLASNYSGGSSNLLIGSCTSNPATATWNFPSIYQGNTGVFPVQVTSTEGGAYAVCGWSDITNNGYIWFAPPVASGASGA